MNGTDSPRRARLLGLLVLAATFLAGAVAGVAFDRVAVPANAAVEETDDDARDDDDRRDRRVDLLDRVDLTADQRREVDSIRSRWHERVEAFWDSAGPRLRAIADSARGDIRTVLTAEQIEQYDSLRAAHRREHRARRKDDDDKKR